MNRVLVVPASRAPTKSDILRLTRRGRVVRPPPGTAGADPEPPPPRVVACAPVPRAAPIRALTGASAQSREVARYRWAARARPVAQAPPIPGVVAIPVAQPGHSPPST